MKPKTTERDFIQLGPIWDEQIAPPEPEPLRSNEYGVMFTYYDRFTMALEVHAAINYANNRCLPYSAVSDAINEMRRVNDITGIRAILAIFYNPVFPYSFSYKRHCGTNDCYNPAHYSVDDTVVTRSNVKTADMLALQATIDEYPDVDIPLMALVTGQKIPSIRKFMDGMKFKYFRSYNPNFAKPYEWWWEQAQPQFSQWRLEMMSRDWYLIPEGTSCHILDPRSIWGQSTNKEVEWLWGLELEAMGLRDEDQPSHRRLQDNKGMLAPATFWFSLKRTYLTGQGMRYQSFNRKADSWWGELRNAGQNDDMSVVYPHPYRPGTATIHDPWGFALWLHNHHLPKTQVFHLCRLNGQPCVNPEHSTPIPYRDGPRGTLSPKGIALVRIARSLNHKMARSIDIERIFGSQRYPIKFENMSKAEVDALPRITRKEAIDFYIDNYYTNPFTKSGEFYRHIPDSIRSKFGDPII